MTPPVLRILLNAKQAYVPLDTDAAISVMNGATFEEYFPTDIMISTKIPALKAFCNRIVPLGPLTTSVVVDHPTSPLRMQVSFLVLRPSPCPPPILFGMNIIRAYGIDILCSTAARSLCIDTIAHTFSLTNRPDVSPRLQALDSASLMLPSKPTQEAEGVLLCVRIAQSIPI
jgi:hypothetical protein